MKKLSDISLRIISLMIGIILPLTALTGCSSDDDNEYDELSLLIDSSLQTVVYVSYYSDGSIVLANGQDATLTYRVSPAGAAQAIVSQYASRLHLSVVQPLADTELPEVTQSAGNPLLTINDVSATTDGLLILTVSHTGFVQGHGYATALELAGSPLTFQTAYTPTRLITPFAISDEELSQTMAE